MYLCFAFQVPDCIHRMSQSLVVEFDIYNINASVSKVCKSMISSSVMCEYKFEKSISICNERLVEAQHALHKDT